MLGFAINPTEIEILAAGRSYIRHIDGAGSPPSVRKVVRRTTDFLRLGEVDAILVWADADDAPARARSQLRRRDDTPDCPDLAARPVDRAPKHYLSRHRGEVMKPILEQARPRVPILRSRDARRGRALQRFRGELKRSLVRDRSGQRQFR